MLGAGGITGIAWLAGAVRALEEHTGWEASFAEILAGTSAGAIVATVLAADQDPCDLLVYGEQPEMLKIDIARAMRGRDPEPRTLPLPVSLRLGISGLLNPGTRRLSGFLPTGVVSGDEIRGLTREAVSNGWPTRRELWLNACDAESGRHVTFGRDGAPEVALADAVVASCAVPSYYRPVSIGGRRYVDRGGPVAHQRRPPRRPGVRHRDRALPVLLDTARAAARHRAVRRPPARHRDADRP